MADWRCTLDGRAISVSIPANASLAEALREQADALEVKIACGEGTCAACTVEVNGQLVRSCLYPAMRAQDTEIITAKSYADGPIATAIAEHGGLQCGFCTPGMVVTTHHLVNKAEIAATPEGMRQALGGNLCRCTGYVQLLEGAAAGLRAERARS
jgi:aerobic-type carbon monoxide dehydrogenase small subunit (CoxS/CutS family)